MKNDPFNSSPHCCSDICGRISRNTGNSLCTHPCTLRCHPSFCPPCTAVVYIACACGNIRVPIQCSEYRGENIVSGKCNNKCRKILSCNKHYCELNCHFGECLK
ncbi:hypothetical protein MXB_3031, partial [Myxobolus squamalis]